MTSKQKESIQRDSGGEATYFCVAGEMLREMDLNGGDRKSESQSARVKLDDTRQNIRRWFDLPSMGQK